MEQIEETINLLIDQEAKRIIKILLDMYKKSNKVNKPFSKLVKDIMKEEYSLFYLEVLRQTTKNIPINLMISPTIGKIFITVRENENDIIEFENIEPSLIEDIANKIIEDYKNNKLNNKNILQLFENTLSEKNIGHLKPDQVIKIINDIILNINKKYKVISLNPFILTDL